MDDIKFFFWLGNTHGGEAQRNLEMIRHLEKHHPIHATVGVFEKSTDIEFKQLVIPRKFSTDKLTGINNYIAENKFMNEHSLDYDAYMCRYGYKQPGRMWFFRISGDITQTKTANVLGRAVYFFIKHKVISNLPKADIIITCSQASRRLVESTGQKNIIKSKMFIDTNIFKPPEKRKKNKVFRVLFVGRNDPIKNLTKLERAVNSIHGTELVKVGVNSWYNKKEVAKEMHKADLLVMPSYYESYGTTALEALACNCPVLLSRNVTAGEDLIGHVYFCETNSQSIKKAITSIMLDETRTRRAKLAGAFVRKNFNKEKVLKEECSALMRFYNDKTIDTIYLNTTPQK